MVGVLVTFQYESNFEPAIIEKIAEEAHPAFVGMPGLRNKFFTLDERHRRATNFYVWNSEEAARSFFTDELVARVTALYGVPPAVDYVRIVAAVENA